MKVKLGVIGCGGYGRSQRRFHHASGKYDIVGCMDLNPETAAAAAAEESATAFTDRQQLLALPDLDAVSINSPVPDHYDSAKAALEAGKHVIMTKPITHSLATSRELLALAEQKNLAIVIGHHARYAPAVQLIRKTLASGQLGTLCGGHVNCCSSGGLEQSADDWRAQPGLNPGGPLLQCGIHSIDTLLYLLGPISQVFASGRYDITDYDVVDCLALTLQFESGLIFGFNSYYTSAYMHTKDFFGTAGNLHERQHISALGASEIYLQKRRRGDFEPWEELPLEKPQGHFGVAIEDSFAEQVFTGRRDYSNMRDSIAALEVVVAAEKSLRNNTPVDPRGVSDWTIV